MKYLEFSSFFDGEPANIACMSTFQFDPDYFERRLLRSPALSKARRIIIFVDAHQWFQRLRQELPARWLNRRYLVAPVQHSPGVFHPKLTLLLSQSGGQVICGSNNLTRAGCSSNLELLNSSPFTFDANDQDALNIAREAFAFFERAAEQTDGEITRVIGEWLNDAGALYPWLREPVTAPPSKRRVLLLSTYNGSMWDRLVKHLDADKPNNFLVISPFHDSDSNICRRVARQWPSAKIELVIQQGCTSLAVGPLRKMRTVRLSELAGVSRRVHAKLLAWRGTKGQGCLAGSANFTSAALDGRNVEASLLIAEADEQVRALFDGHLSRRSIAIDDFEPGDVSEPTIEGELPPLRINSALLALNNEFRISFSHDFPSPPSALRLTLRTPGENRPRVSINVTSKAKGTQSVKLPDGVLSDTHGTLLATLIGEVNGVRIESPTAWVIQESHLTFEPGSGSSSPRSRIEDSGDGLPAYLDALGKQDGITAVIEYLGHLTIRFDDGGGSGQSLRKFRLRIRDPFSHDNAPTWLINSKDKSDDLEAAIYEFVERHERQRLLRHVSRGNVNGMENFLDIFLTLIRLLHVYYRRGVVKKAQLIHRGCRLIEIAMVGCKREEEETLDGYLTSVYKHLDGDRHLLQEVCNETNYLAEIRGTFLVLQSIRFDPQERPKFGPRAIRPRDVLPKWAKAVKSAVTGCGLKEPAADRIRKALDSFEVLSEGEIKRVLAELP